MRRNLVWALSLLACWPFAAGAADPFPTARGIVLDTEGRPLGDAEVELCAVSTFHATGVALLDGVEPAAPLAFTRTDAEGRFALQAPASGLYRLLVHATGKVAAEQAVLPLVDDVELAPVALAADVGLEVTVTDETGRPLAGVRLLTADERTSPGWRHGGEAARTDAQGRARLARAAGARAAVSVLAAGHAEIVVDDPPQKLELTLHAEQRARQARLRVVDAAGLPVAGALVRSGERGWPVARTDAMGETDLDLRRDEATPVRVSTADGRTAARKLDTAAVFEIALPPAPVLLAGKVRDAETQRALAGVLVWPAAEPGRAVRTDAGGSYRLAANDAHELQVMAATSGYQRGGTRAGDTEIRARRLPTLALRRSVALAGRVVDLTGAALGGVLVEAIHGTGKDGIENVAERRRSAEDGRFELGRLGAGTLYELRATAPGFLPARLEVSTPRSARELPPVQLVLEPARELVGSVVDARGARLAGVRIVALAAGAPGQRPPGAELPAPAARGNVETTTDDRGRFRIAQLPAREIDLLAVLPGFAPGWQRNLRLPEGSGAWNLGEIVLRAGATFAGKVVDQSRRAIAGAEIFRVLEIATPELLELTLDGKTPQTASAHDGRFTLADLPAGKPVHLFVRAEGYEPAVFQGLRPGGGKPVVVRLESAVQVAGRVVDEDGAPIAEAEVYLSWQDTANVSPGTPPVHRETTSDREGRFTLRGEATGEALVGASARGFAPARPWVVSLPTTGDDPLEIRLERGDTLEGRITNGEGEPVAKARVTGGGVGAFSDADGVYVLAGLHPGRIQVEIFHPGYRQQNRVTTIAPGRNPLDVVLEAGRRIAGRVVDERGEPISAAEVMLAMGERGRGYRQYRAYSDPAGSFEIASVVAARYQLEVTAQGFAPLRQQLQVAAASDPEPLELALVHGGAIVGQVRGLDPEQLARLELHAEAAGSDPDGDSRAGRVDAAGAFELRDLGPGVWELRATLASEQRELSRRVALAPGETARRDLEFGSRLVLTGRVEVAGEPLAGAQVSVRGSRLALERSAVSDYDGGFRLEELEPGEYWLGVSHRREMLVHNETLEILDDHDVTIRLEAGALEGRVLDGSSGEPLTSARVQLLPTEGAEFTVAGGAGEEGWFQLPRVPPGRFRLRVTADGFSAAEQLVEIHPGGADTPVEIALEPVPGLDLEVRLASGAIPPVVDVRAETAGGVPPVWERRPVGADGRVRVSTLPPGSWRLRLGATGGGVVELDVNVPGPPILVVVPDAAPLRVEIPAIAETDLVGTLALLDPAGRPLETFTPAGQIVTTGAVIAGQATLTAVPAGTWNVLVETPDGARWSAVAVTDGRHETRLRLE